MLLSMGIVPDRTGQNTRVVVVKRTLKNIQKHYEPVKVIQIPLPLADVASVEEITRLYRDPEFTLNKKIFSQDRRPTKVVRTHPTLVINRQPGEEGVKRLRSAGIPVVGLLPVEECGPWTKHPHGRALGDDYDVPWGALFRTLLEAHTRKRLIFKDPALDFDRAMEALQDLFTSGKAEPEKLQTGFEGSDLLSALAQVVWFHEKIPYQRAYKA